MNKIQTINLGGLIITIDEPGFNRLKMYLDALRNYFKNNVGGDEIMRDIEYRIAEKLRTMLTNSNREVVEEQDVALIEIEMGKPSDFDDEQVEENQEKSINSEKLFRITKGKMLGGVANGLSSYFQIDVSLIRALFILAMILGGYGLMIYLILWAVLPANHDVPENEITSNGKLYRNPDDKIIGGVASGIASYLNIDPKIIRLLFALSLIWGGIGFFIYILFWFGVPYASSAGEKLEMKRKSQRFESYNNENDNINVSTSHTMNALAQLVEIVFKAIIKVGSIAIRIFSVLFGLLFLFIGLVFTFSISAILVAYFNWFDFTALDSIPFDSISTGNPTLDLVTLCAFLIFSIIPTLFITSLGVKLLFKRNLASKRVVIYGIIFWFISILILGISTAKTALEFNKQSSITMPIVEIKNTLTDTLYIEINDEITGYDQFDISVTRSKNDSIYIYKTIESCGRTKVDAIKNGNRVLHAAILKGNKFVLGGAIEFLPNSLFRAQEFHYEIRIPEGKLVKFDYESFRKLRDDNLEIYDWIENNQHLFKIENNLLKPVL